LQHTIAEVDEEFEAYEFAKVCDTLFHFAWDDVCDWYVELSKSQANPRVLGHVLDQLLRLLHPIIPFVTDELWCALTGSGESVMVAPWPVTDKALIDDEAEASVARLQLIVTEVRRFRADQGLKPAQKVEARTEGLGEHERLVHSMARLVDAGADFTATAKLTVAGAVVELDTRGSIDVAAERARLGKDRSAAEKEITQARGKLGNEGFLAKAPADVVGKLRERLAVAEAEIVRIDEALARLS
jgi:valyl-tRNA synthetase